MAEGERKDDIGGSTAIRVVPTRVAENVGRWLTSAPATAATSAAIERWCERVSVPALRSQRAVWALCLAFAAPVFARLGHRPHAWSLCGKATGRDELLELAAFLYGADGFAAVKRWSDLSCDPSTHLCEQDEGLLTIAAPTTDARLEQASIVASLWLDDAAIAPGPAGRAALTLFASDDRFDPWLIRARWGVGKLWIFNIGADAGAHWGVFDEQPASGSVPGELGMMLTAALRLKGQVGVSWLRFLNWLGDDLPAMFAGAMSSGQQLNDGPGAPDTGLQGGDIARCFALVVQAGEFATAEGLTGWPVGAAAEAGEAMLKAWDASNLQSAAKSGAMTKGKQNDRWRDRTKVTRQRRAGRLQRHQLPATKHRV